MKGKHSTKGMYRHSKVFTSKLIVPKSALEDIVLVRILRGQMPTTVSNTVISIISSRHLRPPVQLPRLTCANGSQSKSCGFFRNCESTRSVLQALLVQLHMHVLPPVAYRYRLGGKC